MTNELTALKEKLNKSSIAILVDVLKKLSTQTTSHAIESFNIALSVSELKLSPMRFERLKKSLSA